MSAWAKIRSAITNSTCQNLTVFKYFILAISGKDLDAVDTRCSRKVVNLSPGRTQLHVTMQSRLYLHPSSEGDTRFESLDSTPVWDSRSAFRNLYN